jgi:hypothetical protein
VFSLKLLGLSGVVSFLCVVLKKKKKKKCGAPPQGIMRKATFMELMELDKIITGRISP